MLWERQLVGPEETNVPIRYGVTNSKTIQRGDKEQQLFNRLHDKRREKLSQQQGIHISKAEGKLNLATRQNADQI